jgi:hypothetical protein
MGGRRGTQGRGGAQKDSQATIINQANLHAANCLCHVQCCGVPLLSPAWWPISATLPAPPLFASPPLAAGSQGPETGLQAWRGTQRDSWWCGRCCEGSGEWKPLCAHAILPHLPTLANPVRHACCAQQHAAHDLVLWPQHAPFLSPNGRNPHARMPDPPRHASAGIHKNAQSPPTLCPSPPLTGHHPRATRAPVHCPWCCCCWSVRP